MITKKTALKEAGRFKAALEGPLGRRAMQPVIREFLRFFRELRSSGASWSQIAALLAAAEIRAESGKPFTDGVLRAMVSRAEREASASGGQRNVVATVSHPAGCRTRTPAATLPRPAAAFLRLSITDHAALSDVAERIRRASALRGQS